MEKNNIEINDVFLEENGKIRINQRKLIKFLYQIGYGINQSESQLFNGRLIKCTQNIISEITEYQLRREFLRLLVDSGIEESNIEYFHKAIGSVLSITQIKTLESIKTELMKDQKEAAFFPFGNCVVKVSANNIEYISYANLDFYIIDKQIKEFDIDTKVYDGGDFRRFCQMVTNEDSEWFKALQSTIGYLLLSNKEAIEEKAVIIYDYLIGDSNQANGGTGKSLIFNSALNRLRNVTILDGKRYDPRSTRFMYQNVEASTKVILLDDVNRKFNFDQIYSAVTEGFDIEKKGQQAIHLDRDNAPKFVITSNRLLKMDEGSSAKRRTHELFLYNSFDENTTPYKVFGRHFFSKKWNNEDYNQFYYFMFECVQIYLKEGLIEYLPKEIREIKLISEIGIKWVNFFDFAIPFLLKEENLIIRDKIEKLAKEDSHVFTPHAFTKKLMIYCSYRELGYEHLNSGGVQKYRILNSDVNKILDE